MSTPSLNADITLIGGGVAGLWTQRLLEQSGYSTLLVDKNALGSGQTLASQGMIHGGQRYSLLGHLTEHTKKIAAMPGQWDSCLENRSFPHLKGVASLSQKQHLWSPGGLLSNAASFFASKALQNQARLLKESEWPSVFKANHSFSGKVYELSERVIDVSSLVSFCHAQNKAQTLKGYPVDFQQEKNSISSLVVQTEQGQVNLKSHGFLFTAGLGNEWATQKFLDFFKRAGISRKETNGESAPFCQRRPLRQVVVKEVAHSLYGHCITADPRPRITITTHPGAVWYLGGLVANYGTEHTEKEALSYAYKELYELFPHINWKQCEFGSILVDRAEPFTRAQLLPEDPEILSVNTVGIGWPCKMTFAPLFGSLALEWAMQRVSNKSRFAKIETPTELQAAVGMAPWLASVSWKKPAEFGVR